LLCYKLKLALSADAKLASNLQTPWHEIGEIEKDFQSGAA